MNEERPTTRNRCEYHGWYDCNPCPKCEPQADVQGPQPIVLVDAISGKPCPTKGRSLCTIINHRHRHKAANMQRLQTLKAKVSPASQPSSMLYVVCPVCEGSGRIIEARRGEMECPACQPLMVFPVGVTERQLEALVKSSQPQP